MSQLALRFSLPANICCFSLLCDALDKTIGDSLPISDEFDDELDMSNVATILLCIWSLMSGLLTWDFEVVPPPSESVAEVEGEDEVEDEDDTDSWQSTISEI